jgi:hypothetical protein
MENQVGHRRGQLRDFEIRGKPHIADHDPLSANHELDQQGCRYWRTNLNGMLIVVGAPGAGNCQVFTWLSMHLATTGSSPVEDVLATEPFEATFAVTVTFTLDF